MAIHSCLNNGFGKAKLYFEFYGCHRGIKFNSCSQMFNSKKTGNFDRIQHCAAFALIREFNYSSFTWKLLYLCEIFNLHLRL